MTQINAETVCVHGLQDSTLVNANFPQPEFIGCLIRHVENMLKERKSVVCQSETAQSAPYFVTFSNTFV